MQNKWYFSVSEVPGTSSFTIHMLHVHHNSNSNQYLYLRHQSLIGRSPVNCDPIRSTIVSRVRRGTIAGTGVVSTCTPMYHNYQLHRAWPVGVGRGRRGGSIYILSSILCLYLSLFWGKCKKKTLIPQVPQCCWTNSENVSNFGKNLGKS